MRSFIPVFALTGVTLAIGNYTVDPEEVDLGEATAWCGSQMNTCQGLCNAAGGGTTKDDCQVSTLEYECECANGTAPGLQYYEGSMEYHLCIKSYELCVEDNVGSRSDLDTCETEIRDTCGSLTVEDAAAPAETTATDSDSAEETSDAPASTDSPDSGAVPAQVQHYANAAGAVAIGLLAYML